MSKESLKDQIERIRLRDIEEGVLYDCPRGKYAERVDVNNEARCLGFLMGVGGKRVANHCKSCEHYYDKR